MSTRRKKSDEQVTEGNILHSKLGKLQLAEKVAAFKFLKESIETDRKELNVRLALINDSTSTE